MTVPYLHKITKQFHTTPRQTSERKRPNRSTAFRPPLARRYAMPHHKGEETQITTFVHPNHWTETSRATPRYEKLPHHDGDLRFEIIHYVLCISSYTMLSRVLITTIREYYMWSSGNKIAHNEDVFLGKFTLVRQNGGLAFHGGWPTHCHDTLSDSKQ